MFCKNCGQQIDDDTNFCPKCGYDFEKSDLIKPVTTNAIDENEPCIKFAVLRLILSILSIIGILLITFQSCAAGIVNAIYENGSISGSAGIFLSLCWLIAGITGIVGRKNKKATYTTVGFYLVGGYVGMVNTGIFSDLIIWASLSFVFAVIFYCAVWFGESEYTRKPFYKRIGVWSILFCAVLSVGVCNYQAYQEKNEDRTPKYTLTIDELIDECSGNDVEKYFGSYMKITGSNFEVDEENSYISFDDPNSFMSTIDFYFDGELPKATEEDIEIIGKAKASFMGNIEFEKCTYKIIPKEKPKELKEDKEDVSTLNPINEADKYCAMDFMGKQMSLPISLYGNDYTFDSAYGSEMLCFENAPYNFSYISADTDAAIEHATITGVHTKGNGAIMNGLYVGMKLDEINDLIGENIVPGYSEEDDFLTGYWEFGDLYKIFLYFDSDGVTLIGGSVMNLH